MAHVDFEFARRLLPIVSLALLWVSPVLANDTTWDAEAIQKKTTWTEAELQAAATAPPPKDGLMFQSKEKEDVYGMNASFIVARGCEQAYWASTDPEHAPELFPTITRFDVKERHDDHWIVEGAEAFMGLEFPYLMKMTFDEANPKKRTVVSETLDDNAMAMTWSLVDVGHPQYCRFDFRGEFAWPGWVPDFVLQAGLDYTNRKTIQTIRDALTQDAPWPDTKKAPPNTKAGERAREAGGKKETPPPGVSR